MPKPPLARGGGSALALTERFLTAACIFIKVKRSDSAYSWLLYSSTISSTLVSRGLPGRQASA